MHHPQSKVKFAASNLCTRVRIYACMPESTADARYPIGRFQFSGSSTPEERDAWIDAIEAVPAHLKAAVEGLSDKQLDRPYREGGWTVRQVAHHLLDSHINSYIRFRRGLSEDTPDIAAYDEQLWAKLPDAATAPVQPSLMALEGLHERWVLLLRSLSETDFARTIRHSAMGVVSLEKNLALYAWHGAHHVAQITSLREREEWH